MIDAGTNNKFRSLLLKFEHHCLLVVCDDTNYILRGIQWIYMLSSCTVIYSGSKHSMIHNTNISVHVFGYLDPCRLKPTFTLLVLHNLLSQLGYAEKHCGVQLFLTEGAWLAQESDHRCMHIQAYQCFHSGEGAPRTKHPTMTVLTS